MNRRCLLCENALLVLKIVSKLSKISLCGSLSNAYSFFPITLLAFLLNFALIENISLFEDKKTREQSQKNMIVATQICCVTVVRELSI